MAIFTIYAPKSMHFTHTKSEPLSRIVDFSIIKEKIIENDEKTSVEFINYFNVIVKYNFYNKWPDTIFEQIRNIIKEDIFIVYKGLHNKYFHDGWKTFTNWDMLSSNIPEASTSIIDIDGKSNTFIYYQYPLSYVY